MSALRMQEQGVSPTGTGVVSDVICGRPTTKEKEGSHLVVEKHIFAVGGYPNLRFEDVADDARS